MHKPHCRHLRGRKLSGSGRFEFRQLLSDCQCQQRQPCRQQTEERHSGTGSKWFLHHFRVERRIQRKLSKTGVEPSNCRPRHDWKAPQHTAQYNKCRKHRLPPSFCHYGIWDMDARIDRQLHYVASSWYSRHFIAIRPRYRLRIRRRCVSSFSLSSENISSLWRELSQTRQGIAFIPFYPRCRWLWKAAKVGPMSFFLKVYRQSFGRPVPRFALITFYNSYLRLLEKLVFSLKDQLFSFSV